MAHEISEINGLAEAMYANNPAWHGLGEVFDPGGREAPTSDQVFSKILNWNVELRPARFWCDKEVDHITIPDQFATVRTDITGPEAFLGVVGKNYRVVQNREAFDFLDSLAKEGTIRYESAMALRGGKTVVLLARLPSVDEVAPGDHLLRYVMFSTSHDGTSAIQAMPTSVRVVCANTLAVALSTEGHLSYRIRHTSNVFEKLVQARKYLSAFDKRFTEYTIRAGVLYTRQYTNKSMTEYLNQLFPTEPELTDRAYDKQIAKREMVLKHLMDPITEIPAIKGTWWELFNAVTEAIDHDLIFKTRSDEKHFISTMDGEASELKAKALLLATELS